MQEDERFVRDLLWAVNSPLLLDLTGPRSDAAIPLSAKDIDREHLKLHFIKDHGPVVGRYFERLIAYWIRFIRRCEIVAQAMQLQDGTRTVGEIDLVFRDEQGQLNHWEVACKFYLQVETEDPPMIDYVGPNANDTLGKKSARLLDHQLPLGLRRFPDIKIQNAFVKGRIFNHWQTEAMGASPNELTTHHLTGRWAWACEVPEPLDGGCSRYRVLRKPFWLAEEIADPSDPDLMNIREATHWLHDHFRDRQTPVLMSGFRDSRSPVRESERWFVVPDAWPLTDARL